MKPAAKPKPKTGAATAKRKAAATKAQALAVQVPDPWGITVLKRQVAVNRKWREPRATVADKAVAKMLANALRHPMGPHDDAPGDAVVWSIDTVIFALDFFAEHGTFDFDADAHVRIREFRERLIPPRFRALRADDVTWQEAVAILMDEFQCSKGTVERLVPPK